MEGSAVFSLCRDTLAWIFAESSANLSLGNSNSSQLGMWWELCQKGRTNERSRWVDETGKEEWKTGLNLNELRFWNPIVSRLTDGNFCDGIDNSCDSSPMWSVLENRNSVESYEGSDINNDFNNNGIGDYNNSKSFGTTPLTGLKSAGNQWKLVPCSVMDANANKGDVRYEDKPESLGMGKGVYLETSHIDFLMCMALSGQSKNEILSRCEEALLAADINNVTESYLIAAKYGLNRVMDSLIQLIRDNFIGVTQTRQFLELPVDLVELFLSDTFVNVGDELEVFATALRWVDYNKQERICQAGRVLNCVRYERIRPIDIRDHIEPNIHLFNGPCGPEALVNIYRKHALACSGVDDQGPLGPRFVPDARLVPQSSQPPAAQTPKASGGTGQKGQVVDQKKAGAGPRAGAAPSKKGPAPSKKGPVPAAKGKPKGKNANAASDKTLLTVSRGATVRWRNRSASNARGASSQPREREPGLEPYQLTESSMSKRHRSIRANHPRSGRRRSRSSGTDAIVRRSREEWDGHDHSVFRNHNESREKSRQRTGLRHRSLSAGKDSVPPFSNIRSQGRQKRRSHETSIPRGVRPVSRGSYMTRSCAGSGYRLQTHARYQHPGPGIPQSAVLRGLQASVIQNAPSSRASSGDRHYVAQSSVQTRGNSATRGSKKQGSNKKHNNFRLEGYYMTKKPHPNNNTLRSDRMNKVKDYHRIA